MKFIILILGTLIIGFVGYVREFFEDGLGCAVLMFFWLIWLVIWLVVFYVIGVQLPTFQITL